MIIPSRREGLSVAIMEGMALGIPIITTTVRGCEDLITDKKNGSLYIPGDIKSLSNIITDFQKNYEFYYDLAKTAKLDCIAKYDVRIINKQIYSFLESV